MARKEIRFFVVDASVVVKWFVEEEQSNKARLIRDQFVDGRLRLIAPDLLKYEVVSALRYHPVARIEPSYLMMARDAIESYQFLVKPSREAWNRAIRFCYEFKISPYDAIYLGLSQTLKHPLLTADMKLVSAITPDTRTVVAQLSKVDESPTEKSNNRET